MSSVVKRSLRAWRSIAGEGTQLERFARHHFGKVTSRLERTYAGKDYVIFWEGNRTARRLGIFMNGGCDMPAIFTAVPDIRQVLEGTCCIRRHGAISDSHSGILLQAQARSWPEEWVGPVSEKLKLAPDYFRPRIFEPDFVLSGKDGDERFKKDIIIFSIGPDVVRSLYRHKEYGFLVDPGGYWLNRSMEEVLSDPSAAIWFKKNFVKEGKVSVETFAANIERLVNLLKQKTDAIILILNVLTVEPGSRTHNYQLIPDAHEIRRREFSLALVELSRTLDFYLADVDRALKKAGLRDTQMDFAHYPDEVYPYIGREVFRILQDLAVFS
jgi:hypothetical protein